MNVNYWRHQVLMENIVVNLLFLIKLSKLLFCQTVAKPT